MLPSLGGLQLQAGTSQPCPRPLSCPTQGGAAPVCPQGLPQRVGAEGQAGQHGPQWDSPPLHPRPPVPGEESQLHPQRRSRLMQPRGMDAQAAPAHRAGVETAPRKGAGLWPRGHSKMVPSQQQGSGTCPPHPTACGLKAKGPALSPAADS